MDAGFSKNMAMLKAAAHPVRLEILRVLSRGPSCASKTNMAIPVSQPNLSQHLKALREAGIIDCRAIGTRRCFYISCPSFAGDILSLLKKHHPQISKDEKQLLKEYSAEN